MSGQPVDNSFSIFKDMDQGKASVHLDWFGCESSRAITNGFRKSAAKIIEGVQSSSEHPDQYFWAVAFLYRHVLEILLKEVIQFGSELRGVRLREKDLLGHNLEKLWIRARELIVQTWPEGDVDELIPVERVVNDLHRVDPKGDAFRYRTGRDGLLHLQALPRTLSLEHFANCVEEACRFFDGVLMGIGHYIEAQNEAGQ